MYEFRGYISILNWVMPASRNKPHHNTLPWNIHTCEYKLLERYVAGWRHQDVRVARGVRRGRALRVAAQVPLAVADAARRIGLPGLHGGSFCCWIEGRRLVRRQECRCVCSPQTLASVAFSAASSTILYCTILYYTILYHTILYYAIALEQVNGYHQRYSWFHRYI